MFIGDDKYLLKVLAYKYRAYLIKSSSENFELGSTKQLPVELAQLAVSWSGTYNKTGAVYSYLYVASAHEMLNHLLKIEVEQERYKDFSETFTKEVESELKG